MLGCLLALICHESRAASPPSSLVSPEITTNGVTFRYYDPNAFAVSVTGDFNQWSINSQIMERDKSGVWSITSQIKPGTYKYEFNVNGIYWKHDPANTNRVVDRFGSFKSVVVVPEIEAPVVAAATTNEGPRAVTFSFEDPLAKEVSVGGFFNRWDPKANPMAKDSNDVWKAEIELKPGKHPYKFWVDGKWIADPANQSTVPDGEGGVNSVVSVGP